MEVKGVITNGFNFSKFDVKDKIHNDQMCTISMIYSDHPMKGIEDGINCLQVIKRKYPDSRILLFGFHPKPKNLDLEFDYIRKPDPPNWTYVIVNNKALWSGDGVDFELHASEEKNLVVKILALAGVAIKDLTLAQAGAGKEAAYIQQEKS